MTTSRSSLGMLDKNGRPMYNNTGAIITNLDKYRIGSRRERKIIKNHLCVLSTSLKTGSSR